MSGVLRKQPSEERLFSFDMSPRMAAATTITGIDLLQAVSQGFVDGSQAVTISNQTASGQTVTAKFAGGTSGEHYKITCRCTTSDGQKIEAEGLLRVLDT